MKFSIQKEIFEKFPKAKIGGLFIFGLDNTKRSSNISRILREYTGSIFKETNRLNLSKIQSWDYIFENIGLDSNTFNPAHKALLTRAIKKGEVPEINSLVDSYNYISLKYTLPVGGHDLEKVKAITVGITSGEEQYQPMNTNSTETVNPGEFAYMDTISNQVLTRNLVYRQSEIDKITLQTKNVFIPLDDFSNNFQDEELSDIANELATIIHTELGGESYFGIANILNPCLESDKLKPASIKIKLPQILLKKRMDVITDERRVDAVLEKGIKEIFHSKDELKKMMMSGKRLKIFTGIDPTANFIHMGHMIWMKKLSEFQKLGHQILFLIGGFTAMIGDPDKEYTRQPLTKEQIDQNFAGYRKDASKLLDFDWDQNPVEIVNNYDWLSKLNLEKWLHVMSNVTMQHILSHDMFRQRIEQEKPIRLHEVMYPLMQGYDSVHMGVDLEVGGSDQTFNMLTGRILSRNILGKEKFVLTLKLLTDNSGKKMGKTTNNAISFNDSPKDVYGKVMSFSDEVLPLAYELLSSKTLEELDQIYKEIKTNPMDIKKQLAFELTELVHSRKDAMEAKTHFENTIQKNEIPDEIEEIKIQDISQENKLNIIDLLELSKMVTSRAEARRLVCQGGVKVNQEKIMNIDHIIQIQKTTIIQAGKRKWIKLI